MEYTEKELNIIKEYYEKEDGVNTIIKLTGRTRQSIHAKGKSLGLQCYNKRIGNKSHQDSQKEYEARTQYSKNKTTMVTFRCINSTDADIIEKLNSVDNKAGYIKALIRADLEKNK